MKLDLINESDRAEASTVTTKARGRDFEIQLGHLCNNRCIFCSSGQLTRLGVARHIALEPILAAIEEARAGGARRITFLGGEPTIHKGFLAALTRSVELGFEQIVIFTDGVMLPRPGFVDSIVRLGKCFEWRVSIQGGSEESHVAVTGRADSFGRILQGLERLQQLGQDVTANMCVSSRSYRSLPDYPALVKRWGIRQLHVDVIRPSSAGPRSDEYMRDIMPRYSEIAPYLREMLVRFERLDPAFDVNIGNLPLCILPEWSHRIHHGGEETITRASAETALEAPIDKYEWHASLRRHLPQCDGCVLRPRCTGVFDEYLRLHGGDEFRTISLAHLRAIDRSRHSFVLLAIAELAPLLAQIAEPPAPWRNAGSPEQHEDRRLELKFDCGAGELGLSFVPPSSAPHPIRSSDRYDLTLSVSGTVNPKHVVELLGWFTRLLESVPAKWSGPIDARPVASVLRAHRRALQSDRSGKRARGRG